DEDDSDAPPLVARRRRRSVERLAAREAEAGVVRVLLPAVGARDHPLSVERSGARLQLPAPGVCPSGQRERAVNPSAQPTEVRILPPPSRTTRRSAGGGAAGARRPGRRRGVRADRAEAEIAMAREGVAERGARTQGHLRWHACAEPYGSPLDP